MPKKKNARSLLGELGKIMNQSQREALMEILNDLNQETKETSRLLYGEVGSGKTLVALAAAWYCHHVLRGQAAIMCPTTALARQHLATWNTLLGRDEDDTSKKDTAF